MCLKTNIKPYMANDLIAAIKRKDFKVRSCSHLRCSEQMIISRTLCKVEAWLLQATNSKGGVVAQRVIEHWTCDQQVVYSCVQKQKLRNNLGQVVHVYVPLSSSSIPAKVRWCCATGKVTAGLAEFNGSLPPGGLLIVTGRLRLTIPVHRDQFRA